MIAAQREDAVPDRPLRVLWLIKGLGAGGAERLLVLSARYRDRTRILPTVAYLLPQKSSFVEAFEQEGDVRVRCLGARSSWDPRWVLRLGRWLRSEPFDIVHIHSPLVAIGTRAALRTLPRRRRPRIVVTEHNLWASHTRLTRFADRWSARPDEVHLAVSSAVYESLPAPVRAHARVLRYGIDAAEVRREASDRDGVRSSLGLSEHDFVIGTVANLRATKGYPDLLAAAREVVGRLPTARFLSVGRGPLECELREQHARLGLGDRFTFLGFRADAVRIMSAFDVFCLPSHHEGLPIALMEALAIGLPVVATRVGGVEELVTDGKEAVLLPPAAPARLAEALVALAGDPQRRTAMSKHARERGDTLDAERSVRAVEAVYRQIVGP